MDIDDGHVRYVKHTHTFSDRLMLGDQGTVVYR